jgi:hypothetical protein
MDLAKKIIIIIGLAPLVFCCRQSDLNEKISPSLRLIFSDHMSRIDSSLVLDSFRLIKLDTVFEKNGRSVDLFFYKRELNRVQNQLNGAIAGEKTDSIPFYRYEIDYMAREIDSLENLIAKSDTTHGLGFFARCLYQIRKGNLSGTDTVYYFFDNKMKIVNPSMIDSIISRTLVKLKG